MTRGHNYSDACLYCYKQHDDDASCRASAAAAAATAQGRCVCAVCRHRRLAPKLPRPCFRCGCHAHCAAASFDWPCVPHTVPKGREPRTRCTHDGRSASVVRASGGHARPAGTPRLRQPSRLRMRGRRLRCFHQPPQSPGINAAAQSACSGHDCASASCMRETRAARMRREAQAMTDARVKARSAAARAASALAEAPSGRRRTGAPGPAAAAA